MDGEFPVNIELFDLSGKVALITGGSQGLGFAIARGLGQAGATLVLNGRNEEKLDRAVSTLSKEGLTAQASLFDVRDGNQIQQKINEVERKIGPIKY
jgi:gluconate 5-dehydrogenase